MPHSPNVAPSATQMTIQVCSYNAVTDTATVAFDLNDHTTTYLHAKSLQIAIPPQIETRSGNMRAQGEIVAALQYQNRHISMKIMVTGASSAAVESSVAALINAVKNENLPYCLALAWPGMATYKYADVARCKYTTPTDPMEIQSRICRNITLDFECRPGLRGDRVTLQNLVMNPGFEGPAGGGVATTMPTVFSDSFANVNAYSVVSGGAPTIGPANTYVDIVHADAPIRHYRLGETSGTNAYDIGGMANTGTYVASPTLGAAGLIAGDTDGAVTLNNTSSQYVTIPTTGLPTGANPWSIEAWAKPSSGTGGGVLCSFGDAGSAGRSVTLAQLSSGGWQVFAWSGTVVSGGTSAAGVIHHVVATFDGTSLRLYVDGALVAGPTAPGVTVNISGTHAAIGALYNGSYGTFFGGTVDEVCIYSTALSAAQVTNHYNAGHTGATGTVASAMSIPAAGQVKFGSPAWGAVQTWQVRFRWVSGLTNASWYLHYTDANNYVRAWLSGTSLNLEQKVAGVTNTLATAVTIALTHEAWYWLQATQFPSVPGSSSYLQAVLLADNEGVVGAQIASIAGPTNDAVTALVGQPNISATGAALVIGGNFTNTHAVSLFGPGAWSVASSGTGVASGAWDGSNAGAPTSTNTNPYSGGPVTSYGAGRMDAAPAGTLNAQWQAGITGAAANIQQTTQPVANAGDVLGVSAWVKSSGVGAGCTQSLSVQEYNSSGALLRTNAVSGASVTGAQSSWTQLSGTYTTGASCAYVALVLSAVDATAGSAGGVIWWDNCQVWDQTTTGQSSMPYCELRFPNSPAQLMVSGLVGDIPAPALLAMGAYVAGFSAGVNNFLQFALGRRAASAVGATLVSSLGDTGTPSLDTASLGGHYHQLTGASIGTSGTGPNALSPTNAAAKGAYHMWTRALTNNATYGSVAVAAYGFTQRASFDNGAPADIYQGTLLYPFSGQSVWTTVDGGQISVPVYPRGALVDLTQTYAVLGPLFVDQAVSHATLNYNWTLLLPADSSLIIGRVIPDAGASTVGNFGLWEWLYVDGLGVNVGLGAGGGASEESVALPAPSHQSGGPGSYSASGANVHVNLNADQFLTLDPTLATANASGVNQFASLFSDQSGVVYPAVHDVQYAPLYLTLR